VGNKSSFKINRRLKNNRRNLANRNDFRKGRDRYCDYDVALFSNSITYDIHGPKISDSVEQFAWFEVNDFSIDISRNNLGNYDELDDGPHKLTLRTDDITNRQLKNLLGFHLYRDNSRRRGFDSSHLHTLSLSGKSQCSFDFIRGEESFNFYLLAIKDIALTPKGVEIDLVYNHMALGDDLMSENAKYTTFFGG